MKTMHLLVAAALAAATGNAGAQAYPAKPVRIVVPFAPGGGSDFIARLIAPQLTKALGQQVIVDNRPGAGSTLGTEIALKSPADGYTLLLISGSFTTSPSLYKNLKYDTLNDMTPVVQTEDGPYIVTVHPSLPVKNVKQLVALARAKPGSLNYASTGQGGITHLATELFALRTGIKITHIPYKGTGPAVIDTVSGQTQLMVAASAAAVPHVRAKRLVALAVSYPKRVPALPDVPTVMESGYKYQANNWHGVIAPRNVPKAIIDRLNTEINRIVKMPDFAKRIESEGLDPAGGTPEEFLTLIKREVADWAEVVKQANITIN
ncbi:MAG: tripartite tricarboxylate transporter substrate binding protein [Burkholderiales bacterium]|nr:tripartite tricarboxylate transporter substrate binding protein [Burkholderiales bacterium]